MAKKFKVMRKKNIYRSGRPAPGQVILAIVAAAALFAAGWFLYQPAYQWVMGLAQSAAEPAPAPAEEQEQQPSEPPQTPAEPEENWAEELRAVWIPAQSSTAAALEGCINALPGAPVNAAVLELKDQQGRVLYQSGVEEVAQAGAQAADAYDLAAAVGQLHDRGCLALGRIYAFEDRTAPSVLEEGKVFYQGTKYAWLDNSVADGGKPWLNPYAAQAQDYIAALAEEALSMGLDGIVLDGVQFPTGYSLELADYGKTGDLSRPAVLGQFAERIEQLVETHNGVGCWLYFEAAELYQPDTLGELGPYGGDAHRLAQDHMVMVDVQPALFGIGTGEEDATTLTLPQNPLQSPAETVSAVLRQLGLSNDAATVAPVLQAYTVADIASEYNLTYGQEEVNAQIEAAEKFGARSVVLFDPNGKYNAIK